MDFFKQHQYAFLYIVCVASSAVIRQHLMLSASPLLILWISSLLACLYFHLAVLKKLPSLYRKIRQYPIDFLQLNSVIAGLWVCTFYSIHFSSATIYAYEFFMAGATFSVGLRKNKNLSATIGFFCLLILVLIPFAWYHTLWLGILLGICSGSGGFLYNVISGKIAKKTDLTASETLASRFWLLVIIPLFLISPQALHQLTPAVCVGILISAILSMIIQTWANQKSVIVLGGRETSAVISFSAAATFLIQGIFLHTWLFPILILSLIGAGYVAYDLIYARRIQAT